MVDRFQRERMYRNPGLLARRSCKDDLFATVDVHETSDSDGLLRTRSAGPFSDVKALGDVGHLEGRCKVRPRKCPEPHAIRNVRFPLGNRTPFSAPQPTGPSVATRKQFVA
jgi:hypothetical protein